MERRNWFGCRNGDEVERLNIGKAEYSFELEAKTCGCDDNRTVAYSVIDSFHGLFVGKKEIIIGQIEACERLLNYTYSMADRIALLDEIAHLRIMLKLA
jgi:hypothetical protein